MFLFFHYDITLSKIHEQFAKLMKNNNIKYCSTHIHNLTNIYNVLVIVVHTKECKLIDLKFFKSSPFPFFVSALQNLLLVLELFL